VADSTIKPAYLIAGTDEAKIDATLSRLRARAQREGGAASLEAFSGEGRAAPDADGLAAAMSTMALTTDRRYLVADGVERWSKTAVATVADALAGLPAEVTVVLVAREEPPKVKAAKALGESVEQIGGEVRRYEAPRARQLPAWLASEAKRRGFTLDQGAARLLVDRLGDSTTRLGCELDRLALWVGEQATVTEEDLAAMVADTSEEAAWTLSDAIVERDAGAALEAAERLAAQGEAVTPLVYQAAKRLRDARAAAAALAEGRSPGEVEKSLAMHPYAAKQLVRRVQGASPEGLRAATCAIADLEWWTRGGADYPEDVALTLAVRRAAS
jgi:DNA polymerase-3 subunit delta